MQYAQHMPQINRALPQTPSQQIADHYRAMIASGELAPGHQLPTTSQLTGQWGVSSKTARAAIDTLRGEGLVRAERGRGVYVRPPAHRIRRNATDNQRWKDLALKDEHERAGVGSAEMDMGVSLDNLDYTGSYYKQIKPPADVAAILNIDADSPVLEKLWQTRDRTTGLLQQHSITWVPVALIESNQDLLDFNNEPWPGGGTHQLYTVGIEIDRVEDVVTARMPTPDEQRAWGLDEGTPILCTRSTAYDTTTRAVSVSDATYPADRTELAFVTQLRRWTKKELGQ